MYPSLGTPDINAQLKHVHDTFKVSQFSFHTNHCKILLLISHSKFTFMPITMRLEDNEQIFSHSIFKIKNAFQIHAQAALNISAID